MSKNAQELLDIGFAHDRTTGKEDWLTPPAMIKALGSFDLDPCSPIPRPWDTAARHYEAINRAGFAGKLVKLDDAGSVRDTAESGSPAELPK